MEFDYRTPDIHRHVRFLVIGAADYGGAWGAGATLEEAEKNCRTAGWRAKYPRRRYVALSSLPFAPKDREANDDEADVLCTDMGGVHALRCHVIRLDEPTGTGGLDATD